MKIFIFIVRSLAGLLLLFASITYFFPIMENPKPEGDMKTLMDGLMVTTYLMPLVKVTELLCGLSYITGRYVTLFNLILLPVSLNILLINLFMMPANSPMAVFLFLANLILIYRYWGNYKQLFVAR